MKRAENVSIERFITFRMGGNMTEKAMQKLILH